ncbi:UNVERIFIED_CONTAM: hypothetical protein HDU68_012103 [Siphonaria sp. JEL0065]|nr:hypothetical protein HDU68_012103 [Siphonaria sp. JEL0065]
MSLRDLLSRLDATDRALEEKIRVKRFEEEEDDDEEEDEELLEFSTSDEDSDSGKPAGLWCQPCHSYHNSDSFSGRQQKELVDAHRYCLRHTSTSSFDRTYSLPERIYNMGAPIVNLLDLDNDKKKKTKKKKHSKDKSTSTTNKDHSKKTHSTKTRSAEQEFLDSFEPSSDEESDNGRDQLDNSDMNQSIPKTATTTPSTRHSVIVISSDDDDEDDSFDFDPFPCSSYRSIPIPQQQPTNPASSPKSVKSTQYIQSTKSTTKPLIGDDLGIFSSENENDGFDEEQEEEIDKIKSKPSSIKRVTPKNTSRSKTKTSSISNSKKRRRRDESLSSDDEVSTIESTNSIESSESDNNQTETRRIQTRGIVSAKKRELEQRLRSQSPSSPPPSTTTKRKLVRKRDRSPPPSTSDKESGWPHKKKQRAIISFSDDD